jgi:hypothetical protein
LCSIILEDTQTVSYQVRVFHRNLAIIGLLDSLGKLTDSGIPYLSSEMQLLYKEKCYEHGTDFDVR